MIKKIAKNLNLKNSCLKNFQILYEFIFDIFRFLYFNEKVSRLSTLTCIVSKSIGEMEHSKK